MSIKITNLQLENVKRVLAFTLEPAADGLTIIGGNNGNGKTSVLDGLAWLLGGGKREPTNAKRDGSMNPPSLSATLSNGLVVERKGKSSTLSVTDPTGKKHGQALLDSFVSQFALDLPKFMNANDKEKAQILLQILGIGDELVKLDAQEQALYSQRTAIGQIKVSKTKYAEELPEHPDAPSEPISASALIQQQQAILAKNGKNKSLRENKVLLENNLSGCRQQINDYEVKLLNLREQEKLITRDIEIANKSVQELTDESTLEIEASIANIEFINAQVSANLAKATAQDEAQQYAAQYDDMTAQLEAVRQQRMDMLSGAALPLPGLGITDGKLTYNGKAWDCMSGSEQLRVAVAVVSKLNPDCGFVLLDKLEQFDMDTLKEFGEWLTEQKLQAIATRVSTGEECTIIIEDGLPKGKTYIETAMPLAPAAQTEGEDW